MRGDARRALSRRIVAEHRERERAGMLHHRCVVGDSARGQRDNRGIDDVGGSLDMRGCPRLSVHGRYSHAALRLRRRVNPVQFGEMCLN